jgi:hypothetical protein
LRDQSIEQVVQTITARIEQIAARKSDLLFTPVLSIAEGKQVMVQQLADNLGLSIKTTIYNAEKPDQRRYSSVTMHGEIQREVDRVPLKTACYLNLHETTMDASCNVWAGKQYLISAMGDYQQEFTAPGPLMLSIAQKMRENFDNMANYFAPKTKPGQYDRNPRFSTNDEFVAFKGWVVVNCGLSLNGELRKQFASEVAAFEAYPDQRVLLNDIAYVLNSKY